MKMSLFHILVLLAVSSLLTSCKKCGQKLGELTVHTTTVSAYDALKINGKFVITVIQDSSFSLKIKAREGLIPNIKYKVTNGQLEVENENTCSFTNNYSDDVVLQLGVGALKSIWLSNPNSFTTYARLSADHLDFHIEECAQSTQLVGDFNSLSLRMEGGSTNVNIVGKTDSFSVFSNSFGHLMSNEFKADKVYIDSRSTGHMNVAPLGLLHAEIKGSGNVFYSGNPTLEINYSEGASGKLVKE